MKTMKKLMAVALTLAMVMSLFVTGFATAGTGDKPTPDSNPPAVNSDSTPATKGNGNFTVTIDDAENGHTFKAYQIFAGSVDSAGKLSDIEWAAGVNSAGVGREMAALNVLPTSDGGTPNHVYDFSNPVDLAAALAAIKDTADADTLAKIASVFYDNKGDAVKTVSTKNGTDYELTELKAGYYLITDEYTNGSPISDGAATLSRNMLTVVADVTAHAKNDLPTVDKKVLANQNDSIVKSDANVAGIGDTVAYEITTKVPNYTGYEEYYFVINDTFSEGLTFDGAKSLMVTVTSGGDVVTLANGADKDYVLSSGDTSFQIGFRNIMGFPIGSPITVTYTATVNENAKIGSDGNLNTSNLTFSNNPNSDGDGSSTPGDNPFPGEDFPVGKSTDSKTLTYVAELDLMKYADVEDANHLLDGAVFTLTGSSKVVKVTSAGQYVADSNGAYWLLSDGTYTTEAPHGDILDASGTVKVKSNEGYYANTTQKYTLQNVTTKDYVAGSDGVFMQGTSSDGKIIFKGLGEGTYTITEVVAPTGYNTAEPITFTITVTVPDPVNTGKETATFESDNTKVTLNGRPTTGVYEVSVVDKSGTELPSTGGIGTKIFYTMGAILVIGAGVMLVSKKRVGE